MGKVYSLSPKDFIRFAKEDFQNSNTKGLINAITNSKRAIDCQIDTALEEFGITSDKIDNASESLITHLALNNKDLPYKLKLIQALGLAPGMLTSKVRNLRNKLEHYYKIPEHNEVEEAIEIAELFILSIESKTKMVDDQFIISSSNITEIDTLSAMRNNTYNIVDPIHFENQILINYFYSQKKISVKFTENNSRGKVFNFNEKDNLYYYLIRIINHLDEKHDAEEDLKLLLDHCKHPIPIKNVKIVEFS